MAVEQQIVELRRRERRGQDWLGPDWFASVGTTRIERVVTDNHFRYT